MAYGYDNQSRIDSVTDAAAGTFGYQYHTASARLLTQISGPVHDVNLAYEANRDHLAQRTNQLSGGGATISDYAYTVDSVGRRSDVTQAGSAFAVSGQTVAWGYNSRDEVTSATHSADSTQDRAYAFDPIGNRESAIDDGGQTNYTATALNQYSAVGTVNPAYDLDGNATSYPLPVDPGSNVALVWNAENRLIQVTTADNTVIDYAYDPLGRRYRTTIHGGDDTWHVFNAWNEIATYDAGSTTPSLTITNTWGIDLSGSFQGAGGVGGLLAVTDAASGDSHYPTYDGNGNVSEYLDESGAVAAHYEYDPFGRTTMVGGMSAGQFRYRFSTKPLEAETGLFYYGFRWYDAGSGRWPRRDPIDELGGVNLYAFVFNAPIGNTDIFGDQTADHPIPDPGNKTTLGPEDGGGEYTPEHNPHQNCLGASVCPEKYGNLGKPDFEDTGDFDDYLRDDPINCRPKSGDCKEGEREVILYVHHDKKSKGGPNLPLFHAVGKSPGSETYDTKLGTSGRVGGIADPDKHTESIYPEFQSGAYDRVEYCCPCE